MTVHSIARSAILAALLLAGGSGCVRRDGAAASPPALVGAWRSAVQFKSGAFAAIKDLQFLYLFNQGGTMTESSNYDGAPPVPPAYGVWKQTGPHAFEARYEFFSTRPPSSWSEIAGGGGWMPAGHGVLVEEIVLSPDGGSFTGSIRYDAFDSQGAPAEGGGEAQSHARRIGS
jgi:hypothetical protein